MEFHYVLELMLIKDLCFNEYVMSLSAFKFAMFMVLIFHPSD